MKKNIRSAIINKNRYFTYDLDVDKQGRYKRVYGTTKSMLLAKVKEWEQYRELITNNFVKNAKTFADLYIIYIETSVTGIKRPIFQNHIPLIREHLNINMKEVDKDAMMNFFEEIAPYRTKHALLELHSMMNDVISFGSSKEKMVFEISEADLDMVMKLRIPVTPSYTIEDYERVFEKCSQTILTGKKFKYGVASIVIPFLVETGSSMKLSDVRWENVSDSSVFVPADDKKYEISDRLLQLICDFHAGENNNLLSQDIVFPGGEHPIYYSTNVIKTILFHCGLPDNVRLLDFVRQIRKAYEREKLDKAKEDAVAGLRETANKYSLDVGLADKLIQYAEKLFNDSMPQ